MAVALLILYGAAYYSEEGSVYPINTGLRNLLMIA
jgi:hypothetical protein